MESAGRVRVLQMVAHHEREVGDGGIPDRRAVDPLLAVDLDLDGLLLGGDLFNRCHEEICEDGDTHKRPAEEDEVDCRVERCGPIVGQPGRAVDKGSRTAGHADLRVGY
eukprot:scaffold132746_cov31-Tisochrysis_lutea.AAC.6